MKIITHNKDESMFRKWLPLLVDSEGFTMGGLSEWSSISGSSGHHACIYTLVWSEDRKAIGLSVEAYRGVPSAETLEENGEDEQDPYVYAICFITPEDQLYAIALLDENENPLIHDLVMALEDAHWEAGGVAITEPVCYCESYGGNFDDLS